jgi:hypothetical protein
MRQPAAQFPVEAIPPAPELEQLGVVVIWVPLKCHDRTPMCHGSEIGEIQEYVGVSDARPPFLVEEVLVEPVEGSPDTELPDGNARGHAFRERKLAVHDKGPLMWTVQVG